MARIAHLTDMHAGREDGVAVAALLESIAEAAPDLVVVGGDLTQRSRRSQWRTARAWLDALPCDWIATPGNHDIPMFDVGRRIADPFGRFREFISPELEPSATAAGAYVLCIRTASPRRRVEGAVERESLKLTRELLGSRSSRDPVVLVTHHPLVMHPLSAFNKSMVVRGDDLLKTAAEGGVDLLLSGHLHRPHGGESFSVDVSGTKIVAMHGGTACSTRLRGGEAPAWQLVELDPGKMKLSSLSWDGVGYARSSSTTWAREADGWSGESSG